MTILSKAAQTQFNRCSSELDKLNQTLAAALQEAESLEEWVLNRAISSGMSDKGTSLSNAKSYIDRHLTELETTLDNINTLAKEAGYSSIMNLVKGFRKVGQKRTFEYYCSILPDWVTTLSPKFRRWRSDTCEHTSVRNFMVRDWCRVMEKWLASSPSETDLNYVQSEWEQVENAKDAQKLRSWVDDRNDGLPVKYETEIIDIAPEILAFTEVTQSRIGTTVIREFAENFSSQKFTLTKKQYSAMPQNKRDLDKFFYLFEQVTNISLDAEKLINIQEYLCKSGHALCYGPLDYAITDKVTLQLFIDAIEKSPSGFSQESNSEESFRLSQFSPCDENLRFSEITPENEDSLLACLALLNSDENAWGVVPANAPRPF